MVYTDAADAFTPMQVWAVRGIFGDADPFAEESSLFGVSSFEGMTFSLLTRRIASDEPQIQQNTSKAP
jgi:hypothetical protein